MLTVARGANVTLAVPPSRSVTVRVRPSSFSTVPRMRMGVPAGGAWAKAGSAKKATTTAARNDVRRMIGRLP